MDNLLVQRIHWSISLTICVLAFSSCAQLSSFQTGRTLGKGNGTIGIGLQGFGVNESKIFGGDDIGDGLIPYLEISGQLGISDQVDLGLKISSALNIKASAKVQVIGNEDSPFAWSLGSGFELQGTNFSDVIVFRTHLPFYFSYHFVSKLAIYATPRYVFQYVKNDNNSHFLGSSLGVTKRLSPRFSGFLETSVYQASDISNRSSFYLFGVGGVLHFE